MDSMNSAWGTPYTIVTGGKDQMAKFFNIAIVGDDGPTWFPCDVRNMLPDTVKIDHRDKKLDETDSAVQQCIIAQEGFVPLVTDLLKAAVGKRTDLLIPAFGGSRQFLFDDDGYQRSSTVGKMLMAWGNNLRDRNGDRLINCMHFPLHDQVGKDTERRAMQNAVRWSGIPWMQVPASGNIESNIYAHAACSQCPKAAEAWHMLFDTLTHVFHTEPTQQLQARNDHRHSDIDHEERSDDDLHRDDARRDDDYQRYDARWYRDDQASDHNRSSSHRDADPEHEWITFENDARAWSSVLDDIGIDVLAKRELFALAQYGDAGHLAANAVIGKLLKGESERKMYRSGPSAWLHSAVLTERHRLQPDGTKHCGKAGAGGGGRGAGGGGRAANKRKRG
jgi:hypothetical protein